MSANRSHNLANLRMTQPQSHAALAETAAVARQAGVAVNVSLSCSFGCPMEGNVPEVAMLDWCARCVNEMGTDGVTLWDTTGMAYPTPVARLTRLFRARRRLAGGQGADLPRPSVAVRCLYGPWHQPGHCLPERVSGARGRWQGPRRPAAAAGEAIVLTDCSGGSES